MIFINKEICTACKGRCCKTLPGSAFPSDFPTAASVTEAMATGRYTIDWWEGDAREGADELDRTFYIRPAIKGHEYQARHPTYGGECTFLTDTGCELDFVQRPKECRNLMPSSTGDCKGDGTATKQHAAVAWMSRSKELEVF